MGAQNFDFQYLFVTNKYLTVRIGNSDFFGVINVSSQARAFGDRKKKTECSSR